jgi:hypothetical protein
MDSGLRELAALSALSALGIGLAAAQGDFVFVAPFGPQRSLRPPCSCSILFCDWRF